jgi:SAM-dependent methyltransferase
VIDTDRALAMNRASWDEVAPQFYAGCALPEYGPLAATEETLRLLDPVPGICALELGCGSGHSLRYLAERGAEELWGLDLSPVQIGFAKETLRDFAARTQLIESPMELNPGIPTGHFDLVLSLWGLGWTTDLTTTMSLAAGYLRPGGCFLLAGEHPAYGCLEWNGHQYVVERCYSAEGANEHASWKGVRKPIVTQHRTLSTWVNQIIRAGLTLEQLVETAFFPGAVKPQHEDPARWYSAGRAQKMPTTVIIKARKPIS